MIRVLVVDDQEVIRLGLRTILESDPTVTLVDDVPDGLAALALLENRPVDVVLMDIRMPGIDGVETIRRIRAASALNQPKIIILTTFDNDDTVFAGIRAGANGFLSKGAGPREIIAAIADVADGGGALSAAAAAALIEHVSADRARELDPNAVELLSMLTPRELEIVRSVAAGLDNDQIASALFVSPFTVKTHVNRAMAKVGARDRAQLVTIAFRAGLRP